MNGRQRRRADFTDSLQSFRQTFGEESQTASWVFSQDSLDVDSIRNEHCDDKYNFSDSIECKNGSIALAKTVTNDHYLSSSDTYHTAEDCCGTIHKDTKFDQNWAQDETSYMSIKLDLNKCINLFHNEHLKKEEEVTDECSNIPITSSATKIKEVGPCYSTTDKTRKIEDLQCSPQLLHSLATLSTSSKHVPEKKFRRSKSCDILSINSKRDTNYNIKVNKLCLASPETIAKSISYENIPTSTSSFNTLMSTKFSTSLSEKDDSQSTEESKNSMDDGDTLEDINPSELKTLLHSLESQPKPSDEVAIPNNMLRRLSTMFSTSPDNFTERLLTIIEESVIPNESDMQEFPDISLCRLTTEIRKMCKFIDNETVPEWPASPSTSIHVAGKDVQYRSSSSRRSLGDFMSPNKSLHIITPIASTSSRRYSTSPRKTVRRTPKTISAALNNRRNSMYESPNMNDSMATFEHLEAYCKRLFPDEYQSSPLHKHRLQSQLPNMSSILHKCDAQLESLDDSCIIRVPTQSIVSSTSDSFGQKNVESETQNLRYEVTPDKRENISSTSELPKQRTGSSTHWKVKPDDLDRTLIYEIAKKRQRCLDTAKVIMEIEGNSEPLEAQGTTRTSRISDARLSTDNDIRLMEMLMSCKKYQECLEEYKPLLHLLKRSESCKAPSKQSKKVVHAKEANRVNVATLAVPKSSTTREVKSRRSPSPKTLVIPKPKLFVTPGKTPVNRSARKEKRTFFRNLGASAHKQDNLKTSQKQCNISPGAQSVYRKMGFNYDSVMSPVGMYIKGTNPYLIKNLRPKTDEMLLTPRKKQTTTPSTSTKPEMKFRLSPKQPTKAIPSTPVADENVPDNFLHPKVHYKLPTHIRTIKEKENRKVGNRVNELLRSVHDKVVIRHEDRTKTVQTDCLEQPEIHYDSADESVHIEQIARKTHFSRVQKEH